MHWYRQTVENTMALLGTSPTGLTPVMVEEKLRQHGPNVLEEKKKKTPATILLAQFKDLMILILLAAAIVSGLLGDLTDTIVILIIVILNAIVGFVQEYQAEKAMQALKQMAATNTRVLRNGMLHSLPAAQLVPGDIVQLEAGDAVPADLRIMESVNLTVDEAALTGESQAVDKTTVVIEKDNEAPGEQKNLAFKGTFVTRGRGKGIVVVTGMQTELGRIAGMLQEPEPKTPLQQRLATFGKRLALIILALCLLFFLAGWLRGEAPLQLVLTSISLAVAAIPEALPAIITISLALAAGRMIRIKCLIRKLPAVETLGSVTCICTDKTGTLTKNNMTVEQVYVNNRILQKEQIALHHSEQEVELLLQACRLNNDAVENEKHELKGDGTEVALFALSHLLQASWKAWPRLLEIPFDAERKLMTTFHPYQGKFISFTKGAPDIIIQRCAAANTEALNEQLQAMATEGQRVLGFGWREWETLPTQAQLEQSETGLRFLGLTGLIDPPRDEITDAICQCKKAGIIPVMITGDHPLTAKAIATRIGIVNTTGDLVLTGKELATYSKEILLAKIAAVKVYARVSPEQKMQIVKALQQKGHIVAMTGDGVNDAPSLKRADIGIAMGITGTDVSKEAADMVLLDDNFSTIIKAIHEGRRIYDNMLKFIRYLLTSNSGELWTLIAGPMIGLPIALLPIHILWINLVSDGLPALALSYEKSEPNTMQRPPRAPQQGIFSEGRGFQIIWAGLIMAGVTLAAQAWAIRQGWHWQTIVFNVLCLSQMGNVLAIRSEKRSFFSSNIFSNTALLVAVGLTFVLQAALTYLPFLQEIFHTQALGWREFVFVTLASSIVFLVIEGQKAVMRNRSTTHMH